MHEASFLFSLVLLLFLGRALGMLLRKGGQEPLIGEVLAGFVLGISGIILVSVPLDTISQFGILMIMLLAGLTTDFHSFKEERKSSILVGTFGVVATFIIVFIPMLLLFKLSLWTSLFIAAILSNTAIEITAALLLNADIPRRFRSVVMGASFVDDIIAVFLIGIVTTMGFTSGAAVIEKDTHFSSGSDGWVTYNHYSDSDQCYIMELAARDPGEDSSIVYHLSPDMDDAVFYIYFRQPLEDAHLDGGLVVRSVDITVVLEAEPASNLTLVAFSGTQRPSNLTRALALKHEKGSTYSLEFEPGLAVDHDDILYVGVGAVLGAGNHSLSFESIEFGIQLEAEDDGAGLITPGLVWEFLKLTFLITLFLVVSLFVVTRLLDRVFNKVIAQGRFFIITFTLVFAFAMAIIAKLVGLHEVIGVYIAGLIICQAGSKVGPMLKRQIAFKKLIDDVDPPIRAIFGPLFFGYVGVILAGALMQVWGHFSLVAWLVLLVALTVFAFTGKLIGCGLSAWLQRFNRKESVLIGITMCGRGALEFVLLSYGLKSCIIDEMQFSALVMVTLLTVLLTPILFNLVSKRMKGSLQD